MVDETGQIMIIEDNEQDYNMLVRAFSEVGIDNPIKHFDNGDDALGHLSIPRDDLPDFIFLDLNLPGIDGRDVLKKLKTMKHTADIPVIVITSSSQKKDIEACYENGADNYIMKPMGFDGYLIEAKQIRAFLKSSSDFFL